jgi:hypothetical protein
LSLRKWGTVLNSSVAAFGFRVELKKSEMSGDRKGTKNPEADSERWA